MEDSARGGYLQAKERGLGRCHSAGTWSWDSTPLDCEEMDFCSLNSEPVVSCYCHPSNLTPTTLQ